MSDEQPLLSGSRFRRMFVSTLLACLALPGTTMLTSAINFGSDYSARAQAAATGTHPIAPLSATDVSILFPPPIKHGDLANLIAIKDLSVLAAPGASKRDPVLSDAVFKNLLGIADSDKAQVDGTSTRIGLPNEVRSIDVWQVAGIRIDAGAPGLSAATIAQFGQRPQIRLILHPVSNASDGTPVVHDIAVHLIFDFVLDQVDPPLQPDCFPRARPDIPALKAIVSELAVMRTNLANGAYGGVNIRTANAPLGIHPGLNNPKSAPKFRQALIEFLERHLADRRLHAMAIMGLPGGGASDPWIFLSMVRLPTGAFVPTPSPTLNGQQFAEMLDPSQGPHRVVPAPHTNNLSPLTCSSAATGQPTVPIDGRIGASTANAFADTHANSDKIKFIADLVADPTRSHFFNTDCVSCHTETRLVMSKLNVTSVPGIDTSALPNGNYNVRNFGWSPPGEGTPVRGTVTRRAQAETAAVVAFINKNLIAR